jgi:hypothetical protein
MSSAPSAEAKTVKNERAEKLESLRKRIKLERTDVEPSRKEKKRAKKDNILGIYFRCAPYLQNKNEQARGCPQRKQRTKMMWPLRRQKKNKRN